ncbi:hypothetical protein BSUBE1_3532 [Bacillus subtilis E1]|uniref:hypothetical protein n=1 Tax=Bacillus subtilis TaxID=1423 RepID=UPI0004A576B7|nr:hypothetical protein [Bacillus subtilis]CCU60163.1 hypothetical protein BSUBE1_3532 [Bacillus subtilis E1]
MIAEQAPIAGAGGLVTMRNKKRGKETRASPFVFRKACMRDSQSMDVNVPSFAERNLIN